MAVAEQHIEECLPDSAELSKHFVNSIYERFNGTLHGFLMNKLRNEADAQDFAQEVYLRFARMKNPREIQSDRAFLFTTVTNLLRDRSRRLATQLDKASVSADTVTLECRSNDPASRSQYAQQLDILCAALDGLSDNCRRVFWMSRIDGMSYSEIAVAMNVSISMVEKHISAALQRVRDAFVE